MDEPQQPAGIYVVWHPAGDRGQHAQEVTLLLPRDAPLVGQLVGDGGGQQTGRAVHIHVRLPHTGEIHPGKAHDAHDPGAVYRLDPGIRKFEKGKQLRHAAVDRLALRKNLLFGHSVHAVFVPWHRVRCYGQPFREISGHVFQILHGHRLGCDAGTVLKTICPVVHTPHETEQDVNCQNAVRRPQKGAVYPPSPVTPGLHHGDHRPDSIGHSHHRRQDI